MRRGGTYEVTCVTYEVGPRAGDSILVAGPDEAGRAASTDAGSWRDSYDLPWGYFLMCGELDSWTVRW